MSGNAALYHPSSPESSPLWNLLNHYDSFEQKYEERFEKPYGFFRPVSMSLVFLSYFGYILNMTDNCLQNCATVLMKACFYFFVPLLICLMVFLVWLWAFIPLEIIRKNTTPIFMP